MSASNNQLSTTGGARSYLDLYAASLSTLCLLHCLALPLLASLLPLAGQLSENELVHKVLVLAAAPATLWVGWISLPVRGSWPFLVAAACGLGLLLLAAFFEVVSAYEQPITAAGALLLAAAHLWRWVHCRNNPPQLDKLSDGVEGTHR